MLRDGDEHLGLVCLANACLDPSEELRPIGLMGAVRLHDDVGPIAQRESDELVAVRHNRHLETGASESAQPPLQPSRMQDRARVAPRTRVPDEVEHSREVTVAVERSNPHLRRG